MSFDLKIINGDLSIKNGALEQVIDSEKLVQDILKICLTPVGSNPLFPWYGSLLTRAIVGMTIDPDIVVEMSKSQLTTALENFKNLQGLQVKNLQRISADEQLAGILNIAVNRNALDPRVYEIVIKVLTKGSKPITTAFKISTI
jgi:phage baseplate assembly protein W